MANRNALVFKSLMRIITYKPRPKTQYRRRLQGYQQLVKLSPELSPTYAEAPAGLTKRFGTESGFLLKIRFLIQLG
jgi:hypothetical protein